MGPPEITNRTPFAFMPLFISDAQSRPVFVPVVKATYILENDGRLALDEEQQPVRLEATCYGDPATSSLEYDTEGHFHKPSTDVVLLGCAYAPAGSAVRELQVGFRVGPVHKLVNVFGDRRLTQRAGMSFVSAPQPFLTMPLTYERAFGGWDRSDLDADRHGCEPRNPVGAFYRRNGVKLNSDHALPNIEDPDRLFRRLGDTPPPAGFGFVAPHWAPRCALAGTYDEVWKDTLKPALPADFDLRFFNGASPGLVTPAYLGGDEPVVVLNASPRGREMFSLPGVPAPVCDFVIRGRGAETLQTRLDTVIVNMDVRRVFLVWRAHVILPDGPLQLTSATIRPC